MSSPQLETGLPQAVAIPTGEGHYDGRSPALTGTAHTGTAHTGTALTGTALTGTALTRPPHRAQGSATSTAPLRAAGWSSAQLLAGQLETEISHAGAVHRLRLTALGKLILTK